MTDPQKSVFISYRRNVASFIARAIFMDLRASGYDVFMDVETIDSGQFDTIILNQIAARGHFLLILTPGTLERCNEPNDWLRREIEEAMDLGRNIVPLLCNNFTFNGQDAYLTGKLAGLSRLNGLNVPHDYFDAAMERLRSRFLKDPVYGTVRLAPAAEQRKVDAKVAEIAAQPAPTQRELSAEDYFSRGLKRDKSDYDGKIADYTEAIRLNPNYSTVYYNRGVAYNDKGDLDSAIGDYNQAIRLNPDYGIAYINRGVAHRAKGDFDTAITDYNQAIRLGLNDATVYHNRGIARYHKADFDGALTDYKQAIRLKPDYAKPHVGLGDCYYSRNDYEKALKAYEHALTLEGSFNRKALVNRVAELKKMLGRK
jgi:tetratricopeptide (TPR) repeat protein